jgi:integrase/recombinase XerD
VQQLGSGPSPLSSFYKYAIADGVTLLNPVATVTRPTIDADHSSTQGLTRDQAKALLAVFQFDDPRSHALLALLVFTGIRVGEALGARTTDYGHDAVHRTLTIRRKSGKSATVAVPASAAFALNESLGTSGTDLLPASGTAPLTYRASRCSPPVPGHPGNVAKHSALFDAWRRRLVSRTGSARTVSGIPSRPSPWTPAHPSTHSRTAWDTPTPHHPRSYNRARNNLTTSTSYDVARALA